VQRKAPDRRATLGFFKRLSDKVVGPDLEPPVLPGGEAVEVVGESYYQDALDAICGGKCEDGHRLMCQAELRPEPDNEYDKRAVGVYVDGTMVGHLSRTDAKARQPQLLALRSQGKRPMCGALISGGWYRGPGDEGHYGIRLDLDWP
jgi:HIRAN domain